jgi:hypothetical protein
VSNRPRGDKLQILLVTPPARRLFRDFDQQLRQLLYVGRDPPRLVAGE